MKDAGVGRRRSLGSSSGKFAAVFLAALALWAVTAWTPATAEVLDSHLLRLEAVPSFINLNMTTSIEVEIGSFYGAGPDNYLATVTRPSGGTATMWFNFTVVETKTAAYGDWASGFMRNVTEVGSYDMRLEYFDGAVFSLAAIAQFSATDRLVVVTEPATASNEFTDTHNCPIAQEFQRGGEFLGRAYVTYASTGQFVNGTTTPSAKGNITGTALGLTKTLTWQNVYHFWRAAWFPTWNESLGNFVFTASASDGRGNHGTGSSYPTGLTAWKIIPAILKVVTRITNETGVDGVVFEWGETVRVEATVTYEGHKAHNKFFPGNLATNASRGGQVTAFLGYGSFNATSGQFETMVATLPMTANAAAGIWEATYDVGTTAPLRSDLQVYVSASDGAASPNTGKALTTMFAFKAPPEAPPPPTGLDPVVVGAIALLLLIVGLGAGAAIGRRKGGKAFAPGEGPAIGKRADAAEDEWEVDEESK